MYEYKVSTYYTTGITYYVPHEETNKQVWENFGGNNTRDAYISVTLPKELPRYLYLPKYIFLNITSLGKKLQILYKRLYYVHSYVGTLVMLFKLINNFVC